MVLAPLPLLSLLSGKGRKVNDRMRVRGSAVALGFAILFSYLAMAQSSSDSGIEGVITTSPAGPGPLRQGAPDSKPLADITFVVQDQAKTVATFKTDADGRFLVLVKPGHYTILREGPKSSIGSFGPFAVDIVAGRMTKVQWECDSGLR